MQAALERRAEPCSRSRSRSRSPAYSRSHSPLRSPSPDEDIKVSALRRTPSSVVMPTEVGCGHTASYLEARYELAVTDGDDAAEGRPQGGWVKDVAVNDCMESNLHANLTTQHIVVCSHSPYGRVAYVQPATGPIAPMPCGHETQCHSLTNAIVLRIPLLGAAKREDCQALRPWHGADVLAVDIFRV
jgi:hypothetical protein